MSTLAVADTSRARLDPHALPPATTGRFLLLIATAIASSAYVYAWLVERLEHVSGAPRRCADIARADAGRVLPDELIDWYNGCVVWASVQEASLVGLMMLIFCGITVVIYLALPRLLTRRLRPLDTMLGD